MNPIQTLINDTLALDEKATAAPWWTSTPAKGSASVNPYSASFVHGPKYVALDKSEGLSEQDADAIAAFRTSAPKLAHIAKIAVEALEDTAKNGSNDLERRVAARALAAIEREAGE